MVLSITGFVVGTNPLVATMLVYNALIRNATICTGTVFATSTSVIVGASIGILEPLVVRTLVGAPSLLTVFAILALILVGKVLHECCELPYHCVGDSILRSCSWGRLSCSSTSTLVSRSFQACWHSLNSQGSSPREARSAFSSTMVLK